MSLFQLSAYVAGWNKANGDGKPPPPTAEEFDAMLAASAERDLSRVNVFDPAASV